MNTGLYQPLGCIACGRDFAQLNAYSNYVRNCRIQKKRTANALEAVKDTRRSKKICLAANQAESLETESSQHPSALGADIVAEVSDLHCLFWL